MGNILSKYSNVANITISLAGLANDAIVESNEVSNAANLYHDILVQLKIKTGSVVLSTGTIRIYAIGSVDGGATYPDSLNRLKNPVRIMDANSDNTVFVCNPFSIAQAFFSGVPEHWKIVVENKSGAALDGTEGNHAKKYKGLYGQYT